MNSVIEDSKRKPASDIDQIFEILEETLGTNNQTFSSKLRNQEIVLPECETATQSEKVGNNDKNIILDQNHTPKDLSNRYCPEEPTEEHGDLT